MTTIAAEHADMGCVHIGDDVVFLGTPHRIVKVEPYTHPDIGPAQLATDDFGWSIVLYPHSARCTFPAKPVQLALPA